MGDFLPPMRCPTEEDEYLFKLNKFHLTMPMARYGNRPIRVGVNIQKKSVPTFTSGNTEQDCTTNSKQLHECEVRVTRTVTPYCKYSNFILFCKTFLKNKSKKF